MHSKSSFENDSTLSVFSGHVFSRNFFKRIINKVFFKKQYKRYSNTKHDSPYLSKCLVFIEIVLRLTTTPTITAKQALNLIHIKSQYLVPVVIINGAFDVSEEFCQLPTLFSLSK